MTGRVVDGEDGPHCDGFEHFRHDICCDCLERRADIDRKNDGKGEAYGKEYQAAPPAKVVGLKAGIGKVHGAARAPGYKAQSIKGADQ